MPSLIRELPASCAGPRDAPFVWVGPTSPPPRLRELLDGLGRALVLAAEGERLASVLGDCGRAVLCFGPGVRPQAVARALEELADDRPATTCAVLALGISEELDDLQALVEADRIYFLARAPLPARDLAALIESAARSLDGPTPPRRDRTPGAERLRRLALAGSAEELAREAASAAARAVGALRGRLMLLDRGHQSLWLPDHEPDERHTTAAGLGGFVQRTGLAVCLPRAGDDPRFDPDLDDPEGEPEDRFLAVPVRDGEGEVLAVLAAARPSSEPPFEPHELTALEGVALHLSPYVAPWVAENAAPSQPGSPPEPVARRTAARPGSLFRREALEELERPAAAGAGPLLAVVRRRRRIRYVPQVAAADCGAACLAMTLGCHGRVVSLEEVRKVTGSARHGMDANLLVRAGEHFGLRGRGVQLRELEDLALLDSGTILHWGFNHFVVLERVERRGAWILDPGFGRRFVHRAELDRSLTGVAVTFEPGPGFEPGGTRRSLVGRYLRRALGHRGPLARVVLASLLLQVTALAVPIATGVVIDRVIPAGSHDLLWLLVVGAAVFAGFTLAVNLVRTRLLIAFRTRLDAQLSLDFVEHLVRLPFPFFQQRSSGDLLMRLRSNATIREILTSTILSGALDGLMVVSYLVLLLVADWRLGVLVAILAVVRVAVLVAAMRRRRRLTSEALEAQAASQSYQVQMLAGIEALKACGAERRAVDTWSHLFVRELNASVARDRLDALVNAVLAGLTLASPLAVLLFGAARVMAGDLSLGLMLSLAALAAGFLAPVSALVTNAAQFQLLGSYFERLDDVLSTPAEPDGVGLPRPETFSGRIELEGVSFRYGPLVPPALDGVSLTVEPGQLVAVVGPSGSGKSTLAGVLAGLLEPEDGATLYDGRRWADVPRDWLREQLAYVPQQSFLFASSVRANIALQDPALPFERIVEAAKLAEIHDDVSALPMGYETVLADGGSSLSGGQRQRIALARALVGRPKVLILDEATSALDAVTERRVQENLGRLPMTRIVAAHRLSTIRDADRIVVLDRGRIADSGTHDELLSRPGLFRELADSQSQSPAAREGSIPIDFTTSGGLGLAPTTDRAASLRGSGLSGDPRRSRTAALPIAVPKGETA